MSISKLLCLMVAIAWWGRAALAQDVVPPNEFGKEEASVATATPAAGDSANTALRLPEVVVEGRQDNLIGIADSASQGTTGAAQLEDRPILRSGEVLETVPGVIITQHAGGGKANQYFLRGFNLDHGTDFAVFLDNMPLNLPSHAHGEGYADMNVVIPELVERVNYEKGPYYADVGNYGSAGSAHLVFYKVLPQNFAIAEGGMYGYVRGVSGISFSLGPGTLLVGGEAYHDDGPWTRPDDYRKFNGLLTYSQGNDANGLSVTGRAYHGKWNSSDQIASSAVPLVGFFGTLDQTTGGNSGRYSFQGEWHRFGERSATQAMAYGFYYDLDLFSNFTYFLTDTSKGDQFEQSDRRWVGGLDARQTFFNDWSGRPVATTFGIQVRNDWINNGLFQTDQRVRTDKLDTNTDPVAVLPATTLKNVFTDTQAGFWAETKIQWAPTFRSVLAIRGDLDYFDVTCLNIPPNSGTSLSLLPSPKGSLIFGPWNQTELYAQGGFGFHSNDGRGTTATLLPISFENPYGGPTQSIPGLIQTMGAEIGGRTLAVVNLQSTLSLWYLHSDSELQQSGDTGGTVPSKQASNRFGIEWANYYALLKHLVLDLDVADSIARFTTVDPDDAAPGSPGGKYVPEAVGLVIAAGATFHDWNGLSTGLRLRYFGSRDLTSDGIFTSNPTLLLNGSTSYRLNDTWRFSVEVLNILDRRDHDIDYAYESRVAPTAPSVFEDVFHPVEPIQIRGGIMARF
jgi:hypothetical protein